MKKWKIKNELKDNKQKLSQEDLLNILLKNRGIDSATEKKEFLNPNFSKVTIESTGIIKSQLKKSLDRIKKAIKNNEQIIIFGDYDVDGICASAILWETISQMGASVLPFIPERAEEGYGISVKSIDRLLSEREKVDLIITVDNGIVANEAVEYANKKGIDVIITDHHVVSEKLPNAFSVVHTTQVCGAGVAYLLARELKVNNKAFKIKNDSHLELVCLATIADLVPLTKANRAFVKFGLERLRKTNRPGLKALFSLAKINSEDIGTFHVGFIIAPRLNAMGRISDALESLRLLCTKNNRKALELAKVLNSTNFSRQTATIEAVEDARVKARGKTANKLLYIADSSYKEGVIGLVAGRLAEEFYLPSIVISKGKKLSKGSARSVKGFNIINFLREANDLMVNVGGHPMAAGFSVETSKIELLEKRLYSITKKFIKDEHLERVLNVDLELPEDLINLKTYDFIQKLSPFGMANPEPIFLTKNLIIDSMKTVGKDGKHLKINFQLPVSNLIMQGIYFGIGNGNNIKVGDKVDVVYSLDVNEWNGNKILQLKIKDLKNN